MRRARTRARGAEELSAKKRSETEGAGHSRRSKKSATSDRAARKGDLGRALRSVYDDTLREPVPDDLVNLIGKRGNRHRAPPMSAAERFGRLPTAAKLLVILTVVLVPIGA